MSYPQKPGGSSRHDSRPATSEGSYLSGADSHSSVNHPAPLESTGDTLVASIADIPASTAPTNEHPRATPDASNPPPSQAQSVQFRSVRSSQPSAIRLRRLRAPSQSGTAPLTPATSHPHPQRPRQEGGDDAITGRRRSSSEPLSPAAAAAAAAAANATVVNMHPMPIVPEGQTPPMYIAEGTQGEDGQEPKVVVPRRFMIHRRRANSKVQPQPATASDDCYDSRVVDFLDVIDPEVATLSSITNIQNSLFLPSLGRWVNRRPTYNLSSLPFIPGAFPSSKEDVASIREGDASEGDRPALGRAHSFSTVLTSAPQYAILPDDQSLQGWSEDDIKLLNDHVRHLLHSKRSKMKQQLKGFVKYASRPVGFLITLYATLITLFGLAWVLFLIGWIYVGEKQLYVIDVIDNVLVALFAVVGDGMIPWRLRDTYHMFFVAKYHRKTVKQRKKLLLPKLQDHNDLPTNPSEAADLEAQRQPQNQDDFFPVLTNKEQTKLVHHQSKLANSHTFYRPHENFSHHAFPHKLLVAIVLLLDLHSCLQVSLGSVTWSIPYARRPAAATTTILCCSIAANSLAGLLITIGDRRTRKKEVIERLVRQELTAEVMDKMIKEKQKEREREREKEEGRGGGVFGLSLPDVNGRSSSEERRGSGRRSLDALAEGFKRKSGERRRSDRSGSGGEKDGERKEKEKAGSFDPAASVSGLGSVAEADYEPYHHRKGKDGDDEKKMRVPEALVE